jgi:hypothetical protein
LATDLSNIGAAEVVSPWRRIARSVLVFMVASLLTVVFGAVAMAQADVPLGIWIRNPVAWLVAMIVSIALTFRGLLTGWTAPAALAIVAISYLGPEQGGVHRWLALGPFQFNAAALVLPLAIAVFLRERIAMAAPCFALIAFALAWQPDISQLAGLSLAAIILAFARFAWKGAAIALIVAVGAIVLCLSRPDPLAPIPHVEGIFLLAWSQSPLLAIAMRAALAATVISPLLMWRAAGRANWAALALSAYFAATALAPALGAYPVPLAGYGMSFVIGWVLAFLALASPGGRTARA